MTNRLDQIVTRTGDDGTTALADGTRHLKSSARFQAMGDVDELNAHIGLLRAQLNVPTSESDLKIDAFLVTLQHHLFEVGSELAVPGMTFLAKSALPLLEKWALEHNASLQPLTEFILPSGTLAARKNDSRHASACAGLPRVACKREIRLPCFSKIAASVCRAASSFPAARKLRARRCAPCQPK